MIVTGTPGTDLEALYAAKDASRKLGEFFDWYFEELWGLRTMAFQVRGSTPRKPCPAGVHHGVCVWMVDLGTTTGGKFGDKRQVLLGWELPAVRRKWESDGVKNDKPEVVFRRYTRVVSPRSSLRKVLEQWRGRAFTPEEAKLFDLDKVLGAHALICVGHKETQTGTYAEVQTVMPYKGEKVEPETPIVCFDMASGDLDTQGIPDSIPPFLQEQIMESPEYRKWLVGEEISDEPCSADSGDDSADGDEEAPF